MASGKSMPYGECALGAGGGRKLLLPTSTRESPNT
uniref:Uncharacterized protein n=1 Tax=Arundo donax TaxID=35708 RepID=A0A0A8ZBB1_ARUDO